MLHHLITHETAGAHGEPVFASRGGWSIDCHPAITIHNVTFQAQVMGRARDAIVAGRFPDYLRKFFEEYFGDQGYPEWCVNALRSVGVDLLEGKDVPVVAGDATRWEYANS